MKKITLLFAFVLSLFALQINAQVEGFETTAVGSVPTGWDTYQSANDDPGFQVQDNAGYAHEGTHYLVHEGTDISTESTSWIVSKPYSLDNNSELKFYWRGKWSSAYNFTGLYISTASNDPVANPQDFILLEEFSPDTYSDDWFVWKLAAFDLSSYGNQTVYIAFKYIGDFSHDFYIDDFSVNTIPYCEIPQNLRLVSRHDYSIIVNWSVIQETDKYQVAWGPRGFDPNAPGVSTGISFSNSYEITGLDYDTDYDIYVRSVCTDYNYSEWSNVVKTSTVGPPPSNDNCSNALELTPYPFLNSAGNEVFQEIINATNSGIVPSCLDTDSRIEKDLWYSITAPNNTQIIRVLFSGDIAEDIHAAVYDNCGGNELICEKVNSNNEIIIDNIIDGQTYYLQVWNEFSNSHPDDYSFNIVAEYILKPINDECENAIEIPVETIVSPSFYSNFGATDSTGIPDPTCGGYSGGDIWFTVTIPNGGGVTIETSPGNYGNVSDTGMAVYEGDCSNLSLIECNDDGGEGFFSKILLSDRTPGEIIYVRVWEYGNNNFGEIGISALAPPVNNVCFSAFEIPVLPEFTPSYFSNQGATSSNIPDPSCAEYEGGDIWFAVTIPNGGSVTIETTGDTNNGISDTGMAVYSGTCNNLTEIACDDNNGVDEYSRIKLSNRIPGEIVYVRVWSYQNDEVGEIGIGATLPPANDQCDNAIQLQVFPPGDGQGNELTQTTFYASDSGIHPSCDNTGTNLDLWYTVTVPAGEDSFQIITSGDEGDYVKVAIYDNCNGNELDCFSNGNSKIVSGLNSGQTYYIQAWLDENNSGYFDIVVESLPPIPDNEDCANAINLTVYPLYQGNGHELFQSTINATDSGIHPSCDNTGTNLDLWYSVTVPNNESGFEIKTSGPGGDYIKAAVYDNCGGNEIDCFSIGHSKIVEGLTGGETYYIQIWHDDNNASNFYIVIESLPMPPDNEDCASAINLPIYPEGQSAGNELYQSTLLATDSQVHPSCDNSGTNLDVWYSVDLPAGENGFQIITNGPTGAEIEAAIYDDCNGNELDCFSNSTNKIITGLTGGQTYYIQVWHDSNNAGLFGIVIESLSSGAINDNTINGLSLYPNPAKTEFIVDSSNETINSIEVFTISGQKVINLHPHNNKTIVNISQLSKGVYFVKIQANEKVNTYRLIKE